MASQMKCPACSSELRQGFLYVRGIGASLHWSEKGDASVLSKKELEQIDLSEISSTPTGSQAVVPAWKCDECDLVAFFSTKRE